MTDIFSYHFLVYTSELFIKFSRPLIFFPDVQDFQMVNTLETESILSHELRRTRIISLSPPPPPLLLHRKIPQTNTQTIYRYFFFLRHSRSEFYENPSSHYRLILRNVSMSNPLTSIIELGETAVAAIKKSRRRSFGRDIQNT